MKKIKGKIILYLILLIGSNIYSQNPTYTLKITNDSLKTDSIYEFDIYLLQTGSTQFEYANNSQYFININPAIINGGTLTFTLNSGTCGLNPVQQIPSSKVSFDNVNYRLRIAASASSGAGTGTIISSTVPGTKLGRFRVTNTVAYSSVQSNLTWYNFHSGFYTKVFAYVSSINTDVTDTTGHLININNPPLPIVLSSFTSTTVNNNVELNWITQSEMNDKGFYIERNRSSNDTGWKNIALIKGNGTTNHTSKYSFSDDKLNSGTYKYRLRQIDYNNNITIFNLPVDVIVKKPLDFSLSQSYPNPSNPKCKIDYQVPANGTVAIKVYDLIGREVVTLVNEYKQAGFYSTEFDGTNLASGVYIYRIIAEGNGQKFTKSMKMVLVK